MKIAFDSSDPTKQLHLVDRKLLSARLARLVALVEAGLYEGSADSVEAQEYLENTALAVSQILRRHERSRGEPAVDETLKDIFKETEERSNGASDPRVIRARSVLSRETPKDICKNCTADEDRKCRGLITDRRMFIDGKKDEEGRPGGLCMHFVRELAATLFAEAEKKFAEVSPESVREPPPVIDIQMVRLGQSHDGTMPLDGSYDPDNGVLCLQIPTNRLQATQVDEALLMLPYLLFHELFVHGGQGRAVPGPIDAVPPQCSFTEGAVDAAGREYLLRSGLSKRLPNPFDRLDRLVEQRCENYGTTRSRPPSEMDDHVGQHPENAKIRMARFHGTSQIWLPLTQVQYHGRRPSDWAVDVLTRLNLMLTLEQRDEFMHIASFWQIEDPWYCDELLIVFDRFLEDGQVTDLFDRLQAIDEN